MTNINTHEVTSALEDYLEAMLDLDAEKGRVRARDISQRLGVGRPAVTAALKTLADKGLVNYAPYKAASLTEEGIRIAGGVRRRHTALRTFLIDILGMDEDLAEANACRMEHAIGAKLLDRLTAFAEFAEQAPETHKKWLEQFRESAQGESK
jgi:DtxR family Mn-dependent transcriptional regulator